MKKLYSFSLFFILTSCCIAQVILIDQVVFEPGDNISVVFDNTGLTEGDDGENVIWDFSSAIGTDTVTWLGVDPVDHEIAQEYWPDADLGAFIPAPSNDTLEFRIFEFYDFANQRIATLGSYSIIRNKITNEADTQIVNYVDDPFEEFEFPLAYLDEFESDYSGTVTGMFNGLNTEGSRGGTVIMKADATGTIHTPVGSFDDVLRVKRNETRYDTTFTDFGGQVFESVVQTDLEYYDWFQPGRKFSIYRIGYGTITIPGIPPQVLPISSFYTIENGTSNTIDNPTPINLSIFPNPTSDYLNIKNFDQLNIKKIEIRSTAGSIIKRIDNPSHTISLSNLNPGNYHIVFQTDLGNYTQKLMKL